MTAFWYLLAFAIGLCVAIQPVTNASFARITGVGPMLIIMNTIVLVGAIILAFVWPERAQWSQWSQVPWYSWLGALYGLVIVVGGMLVFPKLGATTALGLILIGQFLLGAAIDHMGWFGVPRSPVEWTKLLGIGLMIAGFAVTQLKQFIG